MISDLQPIGKFRNFTANHLPVIVFWSKHFGLYVIIRYTNVKWNEMTLFTGDIEEVKLREGWYKPHVDDHDLPSYQMALDELRLICNRYRIVLNPSLQEENAELGDEHNG